MTPLYLIGAFALALLIGIYFAESRKRHLRSKTWEELLRSLAPVETEWLVLVALESERQTETSHALGVLQGDLWENLGGWRGIQSMFANAERLTALAVHAHHWDHEKTYEITAQMKADIRTLRLSAVHATWKKLLRLPSSCYTLDLEALARSYFEMTECLIELYEYRALHISSAVNLALRPYLRPYAVSRQALKER